VRTSATSLKQGKGRQKGKGEQDDKASTYSVTENILHPLILTQSVEFSFTGLHTTLCSVNQRNCKALAKQTQALTYILYFYSLKVIISHPIAQASSGLSLRAYCFFTVFPSLPLVCHTGSELRCGHRTQVVGRSCYAGRRVKRQCKAPCGLPALFTFPSSLTVTQPKLTVILRLVYFNVT
jgi:hypothetical protein